MAKQDQTGNRITCGNEAMPILTPTAITGRVVALLVNPSRDNGLA